MHEHVQTSNQMNVWEIHRLIMELGGRASESCWVVHRRWRPHY